MPAFATHTIAQELVVHESKNTFVFLNHSPFKKYHLLIVPKRVVQFMNCLSEEEYLDFFLTVRRVNRALLRLPKYSYSYSHSYSLKDSEKDADSKVSNTSDPDQRRIGVQMNVQDGPEAGQTVPHFHMHVIPLFVRDTEVECEGGECEGGECEGGECEGGKCEGGECKGGECEGGESEGEIRLEDENRKLLDKDENKRQVEFLKKLFE